MINSHYDFFEGNFVSISNFNERKTNFLSSFSIISSIFQSFHYSSSGSVFYISNDLNLNISIIKNTYYNCSSIGNGGCIYINCINSNILLNMICSYLCVTYSGDYRGQFGYISQSNNCNCTSNYLSLYKSSDNNTSGIGGWRRSPIIFLYGNNNFNLHMLRLEVSRVLNLQKLF